MNYETEHNLLCLIAVQNITAYHAFVTAHQGIVKSLAKRFTPNPNGGSEQNSMVAFEDLVGDGDLALCEAPYAFLEKYGTSAATGCRFATFAYQSIRRTMIARLRTDDTIQRTEWGARQIKQAVLEYDALVAEKGRMLSYVEFSEARSQKEADFVFNHTYTFTDVNHGTVDDLPQADQEELVEAVEANIEFKRLPLSVRSLLLGLKSNNASLGAIVKMWGLNRQRVEAVLRDVLEKIAE